jgi:non-ribosomal peptide synthetase-like protein
MDSECAEVLAICRAVFETPLGLDDGFADAGGHSILIARLAQRLQAAGWVVPVRALLSDCNTVRKVANRPRVLQQASNAPTAPVKSDENSAERDEAAAEVLSVGYFTTLQVLFTILLYSPGLVALLSVFGFADVGTLFITANLSEFIIVSFFLYLLVFLMPFASLLWVMMIKFFMSGDIYKNNVTPGVYPKWSKMHLRIWCIGRLENMVLQQLGRSAPLMSFALRQLGATVGDNLQCAHDATLSGPLDLISIEDDVAIQTGAYIQTSRWSGQYLHVGPIHLESGCKIGMHAAIANNVTVGRGTWITPCTPILSDVGPQEMWQGAPAYLSGRCTELKRTANTCQYAYPVWFYNSLNILMQIFISIWLNVVPTAAILWFARSFIPAGGAELSGAYFRVTPLVEIVWHLILYAFMTTWVTVVVTSLLSCLFIRWTAAAPGLYPSRGLRGALLMYRMNLMNSIQGQWTWTITGQYLRALAGMRFPRVGASECDVMFNLIPELATADSQVFWSYGGFTNMLDCGAEHYKLRQLDMPRNFFSGSNCVAESGQFPSNFLLGVSTPGSDIQFRRQMRSRLGEPITVAGNPPVKFASTSFEAQNETHRLPGFPIFLTRVFLCDLFSIGILRNIEVFFFAILYICLLRFGGHPIASAVTALVLTEVNLVLFSVAIKKFLIGSRWGADHSTPFWSWQHFAYFFAQDCFDVGCKAALGFCAGTILSNPILRLMGCQIGRRTIVIQPSQCSDWNAVSFGKDCVIDGFLQFHSFENMMLKVKRTHIRDGCTVAFGATVMAGAVIEQDTTLLPLSLVLKEMNMPTAVYEGSPAELASDSTLLSLRQQVATTPRASTPQAIDNTDWLKTAAIILVLVDHFGYFFMEDDLWWSVLGRLAAPTFFFLIGYARTRTVPLHWIGLGVFLTLLDSWNNDWSWVVPNILLSFALIRIASPYVQTLVQKYGWVAFAILVTALFALLPLTGKIVDYGAEGWLWALFGLYQRLYAEGRSATDADGAAQNSVPLDHAITKHAGLMRLLACLIAAVAYIWQEQIEFSFPTVPFAVFIFGVGLLSISLCLFLRGPSRIQPPKAIAGVMVFIGRHTLEIYAVQLAASEIIIKLLPGLSA